MRYHGPLGDFNNGLAHPSSSVGFSVLLEMEERRTPASRKLMEPNFIRDSSFGAKRQAGWLQSFCGGAQLNRTWLFIAADEDHASSVECPTEVCLVGIVIAWGNAPSSRLMQFRELFIRWRGEPEGTASQKPRATQQTVFYPGLPLVITSAAEIPQGRIKPANLAAFQK